MRRTPRLKRFCDSDSDSPEAATNRRNHSVIALSNGNSRAAGLSAALVAGGPTPALTSRIPSDECQLVPASLWCAWVCNPQWRRFATVRAAQIPERQARCIRWAASGFRYAHLALRWSPLRADR
ncbi:hypothetical protein GCM10027088_63790 [Nocardia goodfellowii]